MDNDELCRMIKLYHQTVYRAAYSLLRNEAESDDATQETFVRLFNSDKSFSSDEHCKAWLIRVAINISKNQLKSFWHTHTEELNESIPYESNAESSIGEAIAKLPQKYRAVIHLYYFEGYSAKEIAEILGMSLSGVTTRISRARAKLKSLLAEEEKSTLNKKNLIIKEGYNERRV